MQYEIHLSEKIEKKLKKIPKYEKEKIIEKIDTLAFNPRPSACKKLQGNKNPPLYRIRSGDYRIIYTIKDKQLIVLVVDIGHRKGIYH